ncbi:MAG TPA: RpiB/LacA/LacB family sugar-phosphate isomerase [Candidatus Limnocylindrales bacterium]|nr:RpiB/LacA/LacB family sugar-phosphate isomerase [Candidatus Limnocylindrales bacterium]
MNVALASDHAGQPLKQHLVDFLNTQGYGVLDLGVNSATVRADYPDSAARAADALKDGRAARAILVCGSGVGICIAANKLDGIYAAICHDTYSAHQGVEHDQMNVLCLGSRVIGPAVAEELAVAFLTAEPLAEPRYVARFEKVRAFERGERPDKA